MNPSGPNPECPQPSVIQWMRKRDGEIMRFELEKLTRSLQLAAEDLGEPLSLDAVAELARMASFFLSSNATSEVVGSEEVAEWVEKSLRETGQEALAESYSRYRQRKLWARQSLTVHQEIARPDEPGQLQPTCWDKSQIVQALRVRLNLDARRSREIASNVERTILRGKFHQLTTDLIREVINNELDRWGLSERLAPSRQVRLNTVELRQQLSRPGGPTLANRFVAARIWRDFSLNEIVSRDIADAERRGLLCILGLQSPAMLAANCVDCAELVRQSRGSRESVTQFGSQLAQASETCSSLLAIDRPETWLTLVAEADDSPAKLADLFWLELHSRLRHSLVQCVLNLYGGLPQGENFELGVGPLFSQQPLSAEREFAGAVAQEILGLFQRDGADWPNLRVDWHWYVAPDPVQAALIQRIMRVIAEGQSVAIVYDRGPASLGEGLRRLGESVRPVLDYVGVSLPVVWRDAGSPRSLPALEDGLHRSVQLAVRAAVQRREFARRLGGPAHASAMDHSILAVYPIGLDWTVTQLVGRGFAEDEGALKLAEALVRYLREAAERESRHFGLGVILECPIRSDFSEFPTDPRNLQERDQQREGLTPITLGGGLRRQMHSVGRLHAVAQAGTFACSRTAAPALSAENLLDTIEWACRSTELVRLRLVTGRQTVAQATVEWPEP